MQLSSGSVRWLVRIVCLLAAVALLVPLVPGNRWPSVVPSLSPLVAISAVLATWTIPAFVWLGLVVGAVALVRHRWFCRWVCPTGVCADSASRLGRRCGRPYARLPAIGQWIALLTLGGAFLGYPMLLWLDPLGMFAGLFRLGGTNRDAALWLSVLGVPVVVLLSLVWPNLWCGHVCPLGALQDLLGQPQRLWARLRSPERQLAQPPRQRIARRTVLGLAIGAAWASATGFVRGAVPRPLRPPGAVDEPDFLGLCIRCGNCSRVCPAGIIQADLMDHGLAGLLAPVIRIDDDYCRADCVACTEACPSGALVRLTLDSKLQARIGFPHVDMNVCLLGDGRECAACRNECPYEAIHYEFCEVEYTSVPKINLDRCNGCGACQMACPTTPDKAIVVRPGAGDNLPCSARVSDPAETADRRSPAILETFGRRSGSVRDRPQRVAEFVRIQT
jgi:ferredoxin-type protein NapF